MVLNWLMVIVEHQRIQDWILLLLSMYFLWSWEIKSDNLSPVVRTNPVTGWKSLFGAGDQVYAGWIDNVTESESEVIKAYCKSSNPRAVFTYTDKWRHSQHIDCRQPWLTGQVQVEPEWSCNLGQVSHTNKKISFGSHWWKCSRSVFHTATNDYEGKRQGNRVVSLGEKPFYDPASKSRREALYGGLWVVAPVRVDVESWNIISWWWTMCFKTFIGKYCDAYPDHQPVLSPRAAILLHSRCYEITPHGQSNFVGPTIGISWRMDVYAPRPSQTRGDSESRQPFLDNSLNVNNDLA